MPYGSVGKVAMHHGVTQNHGLGDMSFLFQMLDWLVEEVGVAASAIFGRKGYSDCGDLQAMGDAKNSQMQMRGERHFRAAATGSLL